MKARIDYYNVPKHSADVSARAVHPQLRTEESLSTGKMARFADHGCAYCLYLHSENASALCETEQILYLSNGRWRMRPFTSDRERAVLALTDVVTLTHTEGCHCARCGP